MKRRLKDIWWLFTDCIYPRLRPLSELALNRESTLVREEDERSAALIQSLPNNDNLLAQSLAASTVLLNEAEGKMQSVEMRLTSAIGLSSIAGTIVFGVILGLASGTLYVSEPTFRIALSIGALYLVIQICAAMLAAIRGLERRFYVTPQASDVLPNPREDHPAYISRMIALYTQRIADVQLNTIEKVSQMALVHRAMRNFVGGLALLAIVGTCFILAPGNPRSDHIRRTTIAPGVRGGYLTKGKRRTDVASGRYRGYQLLG